MTTNTTIATLVCVDCGNEFTHSKNGRLPERCADCRAEHRREKNRQYQQNHRANKTDKASAIMRKSGEAKCRYCGKAVAIYADPRYDVTRYFWHKAAGSSDACGGANAAIDPDAENAEPSRHTPSPHTDAADAATRAPAGILPPHC